MSTRDGWLRIALLVLLVTASAVPTVLAAPAPAAAKAAAPLLDLNTATEAQLQTLPGVGEATARKIVAGRPYKSVDDLPRAGLLRATVEKIKPLVMVEAPAARKSPASKPAGQAKVDLNTATAEQLQELPGIGEASARKIIARRPYKSVADLKQAGLPKATMEKIEPLVTVEPPAVHKAIEKSAGQKSGKKLDLNTATPEQLQELPGIGEAYAKKIVAGRPYKSVADLSKAGLPKATLEKVEPLVTVEAESVLTRTPPRPGMVWVNTDSGIYHKEASRWFGKTKEGKFMTEQDAVKAGYKPSRED